MSRADLWQFAGTVALEIEIERANFGCDYDYNMGNQVCTLLSHVDTGVYTSCTQFIHLYTLSRSGFWRVNRSATLSSSNPLCSNSGARTASLTRPRR